MSILVCANVGSLGNEPLTEENIKVRGKLHDRLTTTLNRYDSVDFLVIQESGTYDFNPEPFFKTPISSDEKCIIPESHKRKVITFAKNGTSFERKSNRCEIASSIHTYRTHTKNKGYTERRFGLLNVYRNQHEISKTTTETLIAEINSTMDEMRLQKNIREFLAGLSKCH